MDHFHKYWPRPQGCFIGLWGFGWLRNSSKFSPNTLEGNVFQNIAWNLVNQYFYMKISWYTSLKTQRKIFFQLNCANSTWTNSPWYKEFLRRHPMAPHLNNTYTYKYIEAQVEHAHDHIITTWILAKSRSETRLRFQLCQT